MRVIYGKSALEKERHRDCAVTVGTFDGVHRGHLAILERLRQAAAAKKLTSVVVTFDPHPQMVLGTKGRTEVLTTTQEKIELLGQVGLDLVVVLEFNQQLASLEAENFVEWVLVSQLGMKHFVIGHDHCFGRGRRGDYELAKALASKYDYTLELVEPVYDGDQLIKSTVIRRQLREGDYDVAVRMLGYDYFLSGDVVRGRGLGKRLGYPTVNINVPPAKLLPKQGVYAGWLSVGPEKRPGMAYIGGRLTFGDETIAVEINLFGFNGDLLGSRVRLTLAKYTRPPQKFDTEEMLKQALAKDEQEIKRILKLEEEK